MYTISAKINERIEIGKNTIELNLSIETGSFFFSPGQYIWLVLSKLDFPDPRGKRRAFSIASSPTDKDRLSIIYRDSDSGYKKTLAGLQPGTPLKVLGPFGSSYVPTEDQKRIVMIGGGVGIAPFLSILRSEDMVLNNGRFKLISVNSTPDTSVYLNELEKITSENNIPFVNQLGSFQDNILPSGIDYDRDLFYICGPKGMVNAVYKVLSVKNVPFKNMRFEQYYPTFKENLTEDDFKKKIGENNILLQVINDLKNHVVITDTNGVIIHANDAAQKNTGYNFSEMRGNTPRLWGAMMPPQFYQSFWHRKKVAGGFDGEIMNRRKNGEIYYVIVHISQITNAEGIIIGYIGTEEDITKERELIRLRDEFVSVASHELRTPLTAIDGLSSMILDGEYGAINENLKQPLLDLKNSSERLIHLVNDLLNVSRIRDERLRYILTEFSLVKKIKEAIRLLEPVAEKKNIAFKLEEIPDVHIQADEDKLEAVIDNIVGNAIKFTDRGEINISAQKKDDLVEISITDTGIGIAKENQKKLFGKFEQIGPTIDRPVGTGLGLYIAKEMSLRMGGDVWLSWSEPGKGSTFIFSIPIAKSKTAQKVKEELEGEIRPNPSPSPSQRYDTMKRHEKDSDH